jgi:hypothetical protein
LKELWRGWGGYLEFIEQAEIETFLELTQKAGNRVRGQIVWRVKYGDENETMETKLDT